MSAAIGVGDTILLVQTAVLVHIGNLCFDASRRDIGEK